MCERVSKLSIFAKVPVEGPFERQVLDMWDAPISFDEGYS
jgi:hypothetical protein